MCVCVLSFHSFWTYQPGSHRKIVAQDFSFCGACLNFYREKDSAVSSLVGREVEFHVPTN